MSQNKKYLLKFYNQAGTLINAVSPELILSEVIFTETINSGQGNLELELDLTFDDFENEVLFVGIQNFIKVYEIDTLNPEGQIVYTGVVGNYTPKLLPEKETVVMECAGLASLFQQQIFHDGVDYSPAFTTTDPATIFEDIIDDVVTMYSAWLSFSTSGGDQSIFPVGTNVSASFEGMTRLEAMGKCVELSGGERFFFVDRDGVVSFKDYASTAEHKLMVGKDVQGITAEQDGDEIINSVHIAYDGGTLTDTDAGSITEYGIREFYEDDQSITDSTTAQQKINTLLVKAEPTERIEISVNTNFAFDSIQAGDTCKVRGLQIGSVAIPENARIARIAYSPDEMMITIGEYTSLAKAIVQLF